jgi:septation ring formation regulator EzrA
MKEYNYSDWRTNRIDTIYKERINKMTNKNLAKLSRRVSELMANTDTEDCVGNLTIGYILIWIHTIEQNSPKVMKLSKFQESLIDRYQATTAQVADSFNRAMIIFKQFTGITIPQEDNPVATEFSEVYPITSKLYLN